MTTTVRSLICRGTQPLPTFTCGRKLSRQFWSDGRVAVCSRRSAVICTSSATCRISCCCSSSSSVRAHHITRASVQQSSGRSPSSLSLVPVVRAASFVCRVRYLWSSPPPPPPPPLSISPFAQPTIPVPAAHSRVTVAAAVVVVLPSVVAPASTTAAAAHIHRVKLCVVWHRINVQ